jgi:hypothetical protein
MKTIQNAAALVFVAAVGVLSAVSILGVWKIFDQDVISKSFQTLWLLALVAVIVMVAGKFLAGRSQQSDAGMVMPELPSPIFKSIRQITLVVLIVAVSLLALLGVLSIWDVITDKDVLYKSLGSLGILAFGAFVMVLTCLEREGKLQKQGNGTHHTSIAGIIGILILAYVVFGIFGNFLWR